MRETEEELGRALARIQPPDGFAERVLARLPRRPDARRWNSRYRAVAAAIALACALSLFQYRRYRQQEEEALNVQRELVFALRFTADKLAEIDHRLKAVAPDIDIQKPERKEL